MRFPYDLFEFVRMTMQCPAERREEFVPAYEMTLSHGKEPVRYKKHELCDLVSLVRRCVRHGIDRPCLNGFVFSYSIPRISREYDLLKVGQNVILDIELKSQRVPQAKLFYQMRRNAHYLSFLGKKTCVLSYCPLEDEWHELHGDSLRIIGWTDACARMASAEPFAHADYDGLFTPARYLVSPLVDFDRFSAGHYFLSDQQEEAKNKVMAYLELEGSGGVVVTGGPGTGKSLLLFDVAKAMAEATGRSAAVFHGASLSKVHRDFNARCHEIDILHPMQLQDAELSRYCFVGFDEAHRMYPNQFEAAIERANDAEVPFLVMMDPKQKMSKKEEDAAVDLIAKGLVPSERFFELKGKFRTNRTVSDFVEAFVYGVRSRLSSAEGIDVVFASSETEAVHLVALYRQAGYQPIAMSPSKYESSVLNRLQPVGRPSTHGVIGLEYDKVVMVVSFVHMEGEKLCDDDYPDPSLLPTRLIYQGLTRARDAIAVIVLGAWDVYQRAVELLASAYRGR